MQAISSVWRPLAFLPATLSPTQGWSPGLPHCRQILYQLSHQGSPRILEWVAYIPSPGDLPNPGIELGSPELHVDSLISCIARWISLIIATQKHFASSRSLGTSPGSMFHSLYVKRHLVVKEGDNISKSPRHAFHTPSFQRV